MSSHERSFEVTFDSRGGLHFEGPGQTPANPIQDPFGDLRVREARWKIPANQGPGQGEGTGKGKGKGKGKGGKGKPPGKSKPKRRPSGGTGKKKRPAGGSKRKRPTP